MEKQVKLLRQGRCCNHHWAIVQGIGFTAFLERWWAEMKDAYSVHLAGEINRYASQGIGSLHFQSKDAFGNSFYIHPELKLHTLEELEACGTIGFNYYPGRRITSPLPPLQNVSIPLLDAEGKEEFTMLPEVWKFIHAARYDLLIVAKPDDCVFFSWYESSYGNQMLCEAMFCDDPF